ncbi:hypothetical protein BB558_007353 [Smittium angustum]|nr:hypothetical protein BB558_007353 [Smittium angustum]
MIRDSKNSSLDLALAIALVRKKNNNSSIQDLCASTTEKIHTELVTEELIKNLDESIKKLQVLNKIIISTPPSLFSNYEIINLLSGIKKIFSFNLFKNNQGYEQVQSLVSISLTFGILHLENVVAIRLQKKSASNISNPNSVKEKPQSETNFNNPFCTSKLCTFGKKSPLNPTLDSVISQSMSLFSSFFTNVCSSNPYFYKLIEMALCSRALELCSKYTFNTSLPQTQNCHNTNQSCNSQTENTKPQTNLATNNKKDTTLETGSSLGPQDDTLKNENSINTAQDKLCTSNNNKPPKIPYLENIEIERLENGDNGGCKSTSCLPSVLMELSTIAMHINYINKKLSSIKSETDSDKLANTQNLFGITKLTILKFISLCSALIKKNSNNVYSSTPAAKKSDLLCINTTSSDYIYHYLNFCIFLIRNSLLQT